MKKLVLSIVCLTLTAGIFAQDKKADEIAKFESEVIDLGKIKQGTPTAAKFIVANIGNEPLIIEQANPTCGCTVSDYTKEPITVGSKGEINATYNAASPGAFEKRLTVKFAGADEIKSITIKGQVLSADEYAQMNGEILPEKAAPKAQEVKTAVAPAKKPAATTAKPKPASTSVKKP